MTELIASAIFEGGEGEWDNFHLTYKETISEPGFDFIKLIKYPGCPECIHIHWRWSNTITEPQFEGGRPLIPRGSPQKIYFAVTAFTGKETEAEVDPADYRNLANGESLKGNSPVLWYDATSTATKDEFFTHGGFFVPR